MNCYTITFIFLPFTVCIELRCESSSRNLFSLSRNIAKLSYHCDVSEVNHGGKLVEKPLKESIIYGIVLAVSMCIQPLRVSSLIFNILMCRIGAKSRAVCTRHLVLTSKWFAYLPVYQICTHSLWFHFCVGDRV